MNVTSTGIAVALAVIVVLGFFLFGIINPFQTGPSGASGDATASGTTTPNATIMITDTVEGTGALAAPGASVTVNYVGMFENGEVFDASAKHGQPFTFTLGAGEVIAGWDQGIAGMRVGGKRHLVIPGDLAYGPQGRGAIPPNATLVFDVELVSVAPAN